MSFNRVWIRVHELPGGWLERHQADALDLREQFEITCYGLETHGHHVVLSAGQGHSFDEIFFFKSSTDAQEFFDHGFLKWESFIANDDEGCGFEQISLYQAGKRVASKSCADKWPQANRKRGTVMRFKIRMNVHFQNATEG